MKLTLKFKDHKINQDLWLSKDSLFNAFYGDFYDFIKSHNGEEDLLKYNIKSKDDFYAFADWYSDGKESCYGMGFAFHNYFLTVEEGGQIENQPKDTFIGYCYQNKKYIDFLNFLITFFAWWRNDEGCTRFVPYNHADDFFNSNWAALVDTSKLFYFNSKTVYHWQSDRVKYTLDHIPGVILSSYKECLEIENGALLPQIEVAGYRFEGWFDGDKEVKSYNGEKELLAKLVRVDIYNYWEVEEKTIIKEYDPNYKKVDPA